MYYLLKTCSFAVITLFLFGFQSNDSAWQEYFQNNQVKIETKTDACNNVKDGINNSYTFLRISNKSQDKVKVSFFKETWYDGVCSNCDKEKQEFMTEITLEANETIEGNCTSGKNLKILHSMQHGSNSVLTKFNLNNITIQKLK